MYNVAPDVNVSILGNTSGEDKDAKQPSLVFGPPTSLLGMPRDDTVDASAEGSGSGNSGSNMMSFKELRRRQYLTAHERMVRDAETRKDKNKKRKQKKRYQAMLVKEDDAMAVEEKVEEVAQQQQREPIVGSSEAESTNKRKREQDTFEPYCEQNPDRPKDYQGRGVLFCSKERSFNPACAPPSKLVHAFKGHGSGVQAMSWVTPTAHLLLSSDLDGVTYLWDCFGEQRSQVAKYVGHKSLIRNVGAEQSGATFSTSSVDGYIRQWDTETSALASTTTFRDGGVPCATHVYHPEPDSQHLLLAGYDKKIVLFDLRMNSKVAKEWDGHTQPIMNLTYVDGGKRFVSTAEDKSLRTWDYRAAVPIKVVADVSMHAIPHCVDHPSDGTFAAQSLDNRVVVFANDGCGKLLPLKDRVFQGHVVSGTACRIDTSRDGEFISSGDSTGSLYIWNYKKGGAPVKKFRAHGKMLVSHLWHPQDGSKIVTSGWDGIVKLWA